MSSLSLALFDVKVSAPHCTALRLRGRMNPGERDAGERKCNFACIECGMTDEEAALKQMGFDYVFDTNFTTDLTIMEVGSEFIERFTHHGKYRWPMFTACCPGWVKFLKIQYPDYAENLSTEKSPQQMLGKWKRGTPPGISQ